MESNSVYLHTQAVPISLCSLFSYFLFCSDVTPPFLPLSHTPPLSQDVGSATPWPEPFDSVGALKVRPTVYKLFIKQPFYNLKSSKYQSVVFKCVACVSGSNLKLFDFVVLRMVVGVGGGIVVKNDTTAEWHGREKELGRQLGAAEERMKAGEEGEGKGGGQSSILRDFRAAAKAVDISKACCYAGEGVGSIETLESAEVIVRRVEVEAIEHIRRVAGLVVEGGASL